MNTKDPKTIFLKDYKPSDYRAKSIELSFDLHETATRVTSRMEIERGEGVAPGSPLILTGEKTTLLSVAVNGETLNEEACVVDDHTLTLKSPPQDEAFTLRIENEINPKENTALLGLYISNDFFVTQCEPEGFRRITYSFDRPDVMATFRTRIEADKEKYPILLSNGNCIASGDLDKGRHFAVWEDPHPKRPISLPWSPETLPSMRAGFAPGSGRDVALKIFVEQGKQDRCDWAMESLKRAMTWDEEVFGFEYDLDIFMIVAISAFNGGAMENKGLNVFNDKYILADPATATDLDYENIEGVVAHEYFHNWTGNRITCRDWFQLCLKEGLTVFRDQLFSSDMRSEAVKRIQDVQALRRVQFAEDAGPLAHPVRPDHFIEIDNFFTSTVYEKGAELCRMIQTVIGREGFKKGMTLYQTRHDGEAATVEQFVAAMGDANETDLSDFLTWYAQSGTPEICSETNWDEKTQVLELTLSQETRSTPDQETKVPLRVPVALGLVGEDGADVTLQLEGESAPGATTRVFNLDASQRTFRFTGVASRVTPSLFRGFSAPVRIVDEVTEATRLHQMAHDSDPFNRWEAARGYILSVATQMAQALAAGKTPQVPASFIAATGAILEDESLDPAFRALALAVPSEREIGLEMDVVRVGPIHEARNLLKKQTGKALAENFASTYRTLRTNEPFSPDAASAGRRALGNTALSWLVATGEPEFEDLALTQYQMSDNMTDTMAALQLIANFESPARTACLASFYDKWTDESTIVDKWLQIEAMSSVPGTLDRVRALMEHEAFSLKVPNRTRALLNGFAIGNPLHFHAASGEGWRFVADQVLALDGVNPASAASLCEAFAPWAKFEAASKAAMKAELERIAGTQRLSRNLYEIATKLLA